MIRFIDLKGQIYLDERPCFAFYNTVNDAFCIFSCSHTWDSIEDFKSDYMGDVPDLFLSLIPKNYFPLVTYDYEQWRKSKEE